MITRINKFRKINEESSFDTDWNNVDLENESHLNMLEPYSFDDLLLEIDANIANEDINENTVRKQFQETLKQKIDSANSIFEKQLIEYY